MSVIESGWRPGLGWHGRYLWIDLEAERGEPIPIGAPVLRAYVGGVGLGVWLLHRHTPDGVDPLSPAAPLVIAFSPLVGSPLTTTAKFAVLCKSPLTERLNDGLCSSTFALAGKRTGFDALVITGRAAAASLLVVEEEDVRIEPAGALWGLPTDLAERRLGEMMPADAASLVIGPAGERMVRYATASHAGRHLGRGGTGAVLGSKNLKAIVVRGGRHVSAAEPAALGRLARQLQRAATGPATEKYRRLGTMANVELLDRLGVLPQRNFTGTDGGHGLSSDRLTRGALESRYQVVRGTCAACNVACEHRLVEPHRQGDGGVRMEYENLYALGPLCGIDAPEVVREASRRCDRLGLDTISAGVTIALAMTCNERRWWDGGALRFGAADALLDVLERIAAREGVGAMLAEGSRRFAARVGHDAPSMAAEIKGLELPGFEPRAMQHLALGMAVSARGADHNRSGAYEVDLGGDVDRLSISPAAAARVASSEDDAALYDSLILCKFIRRAVGRAARPTMARMLQHVTGMQWRADDLQRVAGRIATARRWFNVRQGATAGEDTLPERFFVESIRVGSRAVRIDRSAFRRSVEAYYEWRGWGPDGVPRLEQVEDLRIEPFRAVEGKGVERP